MPRAIVDVFPSPAVEVEFESPPAGFRMQLSIGKLDVEHGDVHAVFVMPVEVKVRVLEPGRERRSGKR
jgi:hypothetical protein